MKRVLLVLSLFASALIVPLNCGGEREQVIVDGSSTVFPISREVSSRFQQQTDKPYFAPVSSHGTGGGFKKYVRGESDINDASRPITPSELEKARKNDIGIIELPIAYDGVSVVVNNENDWVDHLTMEELKKIWQPNSSVDTWSDLRSSFPDEPIKLFGPDTESGTFDFFTETVVGEAGKSRKDYSPNSDDNVLVQGVAGNKYALGYFGYAYYAANKDKLNIVSVKAGEDPVEPTKQTIAEGKYPLARPLFIYVRPDAAERDAVQAYVDFYLNNAPEAVQAAGYVPLPDELYKQVHQKFKQRVTGTMYGDDYPADATLPERLKMSLEQAGKDSSGNTGGE
jgi:phosphate transport system substrate-binding protein